MASGGCAGTPAAIPTIANAHPILARIPLSLPRRDLADDRQQRLNSAEKRTIKVSQGCGGRLAVAGKLRQAQLEAVLFWYKRRSLRA
jgi:hypothetical protein